MKQLSLRDRRVLKASDLTVAGMFLVPTWKGRRELLKWIETNTSGMFYLGKGFVTFADSGDVLMYKLGPHYDPNRVEKAEKNHTYRWY